MPADTYQEFKDAAEARYQSAKSMWKRAGRNNLAHLSSACYLAGYTVEMFLKAAIIKIHGKDRLSAFAERRTKKVRCQLHPDQSTCWCQTCGEMTRTDTKRPFRHHDLEDLIEALNGARDFTATYGTWRPRYGPDIIPLWDVEYRYDAVWIASKDEADKFMTAVCKFYLTIRGEGLAT